MSMETDLRDKILGNAAVAALIGTRMYPESAAYGTALPCLVMQRISTHHTHSHSGISGYAVARMQITALAETPEGRIALGEAVRLAIDAFVGTQGSFYFAIYLADTRDDYLDDVPVYRRQLDFEVQYNEPDV